jgi:hypothetical protein
MMRKHASYTYNYALWISLILAVVGFGIILTGSIAQISWALRIGTGLFLLGFAGWGFANGGAFVWGFLRTLHRYGIREFVSHPWSSALYIHPRWRAVDRG